MAKRGIYCLGKVRANRLKECSLKSEKEQEKMGRGSSDEKIASRESVQVIATKWHDNHAVTMLSTYAGEYPTSTIERWDRKTKEMVDNPLF